MKKKNPNIKKCCVRAFAGVLAALILSVSLCMPAFAWSGWQYGQAGDLLLPICPHSMGIRRTGGNVTNAFEYSIPVPRFYTGSQLSPATVQQNTTGNFDFSYKIWTASTDISAINNFSSVKAYSLVFDHESGITIGDLAENWYIDFYFDDFYVPTPSEAVISSGYLPNRSTERNISSYGFDSLLPWFVIRSSVDSNYPNTAITAHIEYSYDLVSVSGTYPVTTTTGHYLYSVDYPVRWVGGSVGFPNGFSAFPIFPVRDYNCIVSNLHTTVTFSPVPTGVAGSGRWYINTDDMRLVWYNDDPRVGFTNNPCSVKKFYSENAINSQGFSSNESTGTSFISESLDAFFGFEIFPGFSIAGVVATLIGLSLLIAFLKLFAGG